MQKRIIFLDGAFVPSGPSFLAALSPGILVGKGVFETMRAYEGTIFAPEKHLSRFSGGLKAFKIKTPYSPKRITELLYQTLYANHLKNARLRLTAWKAGYHARLSIIALPYRPFSQKKYHHGFRAKVSKLWHHQNPRYPRVKSIDYRPFLFAFHRSQAQGNDEVIFLNRQGYLTEGSRSNIFFAKDNVLYTPSLACGCLNGITRQIVLKSAKRIGITYKEVRVPVAALFQADEAFLTNSLMEIMPLTYLGGRKIATGKIGKLTSRIMRSYRKIVKDSVR